MRPYVCVYPSTTNLTLIVKITCILRGFYQVEEELPPMWGSDQEPISTIMACHYPRWLSVSHTFIGIVIEYTYMTKETIDGSLENYIQDEDFG